MASTYLSKTFSSSGTSDKIWTMSAWVKKSNPSTEGVIFAAGTSEREFIRFESSGELTYRRAAGTTFQLTTNKKFRDPNAWYHIVIAVDTSQSTDTNKYKLYINGVQETSFGTAVYMNNNYLTKIGGGQLHTIGKDSEQSAYFDGCISHFHFCDGTQLAPTVFGETDSTTGEWKIKNDPDTYTLGTNGFTVLKNGNTITDQSSNSNDFALGGGTLTKTEDCPSNVFCTINPLFKHTISSAYSPNLVQGNTTWYPSSNNGHSWGRSSLGWTSGKYYMEFKIEEANSGQSSGVFMIPTDLPQNISPQTPSNTTYGWQIQYSNTNQNFYTTNGGTTVSTITTSIGANPIVMMAIDADNNKMWIGHNGTWYNNNNASTTLNNSYPDHTWTPGTYGDMYQLSFQSYYNSSNYNNNRANFGNGYFGTTAVSSAGTNASGNGIFEYDVPTGFTALSTKGLNL